MATLLLQIAATVVVGIVWLSVLIEFRDEEPVLAADTLALIVVLLAIWRAW